MEFIETFPYVIWYKQGKQNIIIDTLSHKYAYLSTLNTKLLGIENIKELYFRDDYFLFLLLKHVKRRLLIKFY